MIFKDLPRGAPLFCDTSFFFAFLVPQDDFHAEAGRAMEEIGGKRAVLHTTWDVVSETVTLLCYRASSRLAVAFLESVYPSLVIVDYDENLKKEIIRFYKKFVQKYRLSLCDVASFVVVTYLLDYAPCLSFDGDFLRLGLDVLRAGDD